MADYASIDSLLNTTDGMMVFRNNSKNDDGTDTVTGVSWFKFSSVVASSIYVSGNNWIGFGTASEQLKIWRRDGATYYVYYQIGTIKGAVSFYKLRVEGYTQYSSTSTSYALKYEVFLFDDGRMFVNVIQTPTAADSSVTKALVCGGQTLTLTIGTNDVCPVQIILTPADATTGTGWSAEYKKITFDTIRYLVKSGTTYYTVVDGAMSALSDVTDLTASVFTEHGASVIPTSALLITLASPTIYKWSDGQTISNLIATVTALPPNQTVVTDNFDMTDSTILGIEKVTADSDNNTLYAVSFDNGITWYAYVDSAWVVLTEAQSGMTKVTLNGIGTDAWATMATTGHYKFRFVLFENSYVNSIVVDYLN